MSRPLAQNVTPDWLETYDAFVTTVREAIAEEAPSRQGAAFSSMAAVLIPSTDAGQGFADIEQSDKLSHDQGIDALSGVDTEGRRLVIQAKLSLGTKKEIDSIMSHFWQYENTDDDDDGALFALDALSAQRELSRYIIVTLDRPRQALVNYTKSSLASRPFYDRLKSEGRLHVIDGEALWKAAKKEYARAYAPPAAFTIKSSGGWLENGRVRVGVVQATELVELYHLYGDGLFFENIRSFLGLDRNADRETVNRRILATAREIPSEFLARNNGITLRASDIEPLDAQTLHLANPSIVNGCQTTMCLVEAAASEGLEEAFVTVKIVESSDAWEVTHSANYQNRVRQIDLDLARYIRPQLVTQVASARGLALDDADGAIQELLTNITAQRLAYEDVKYLYRGLFSTHPNDLFDNNYNKLRSDVLDAFHDSDSKAETLFNRIFDVALASAEEFSEVRKLYVGNDEWRQFDRLDKPSYKSYLALLAASAACGMDLDVDQPDARVRATYIQDFLDAAVATIETDRAQFASAVKYSYQVLIERGLEGIDAKAGDSRVPQRLHHLVSDAPFSQLYRRVRVRLAGDSHM